MRRAKGRPDLLFTHRRTLDDRDLWVLPISSFSLAGWLPLGGLLRQFPQPLVRLNSSAGHRTSLCRW